MNVQILCTNFHVPIRFLVLHYSYTIQAYNCIERRYIDSPIIYIYIYLGMYIPLKKAHYDLFGNILTILLGLTFLTLLQLSISLCGTVYSMT